MTVTTKAGRRLATVVAMLAVALVTAGAQAADVRVIGAGAVAGNRDRDSPGLRARDGQHFLYDHRGTGE